MIPAGKREAILDLLDEEGIDYVLTDETSGRQYTGVVSFPLPVGAVEPVLQKLREAGVERESYTVVLDAETVVSKKFERLKERFEAESEGSDRIAREELKTQAENMAPEIPSYVLLTVVSVVIATAGVLLDSAAVVVGSMVIAPLIGPAMATSVGTVLDDADLFARGARLQILGLVVAIVAAAAFTAILRTLHLIPPMDILLVGQVQERLRPDMLSLAVALGAGIAGAMSLRSGVSASLVGVMIAVALVPPTAVIGIGIAYMKPLVVLGATVLVMVNVLSINLAATATLWYSGYRPEHWFRLDEARAAAIKRVAILVGSIAILSVFLGGVTYMSYKTADIENDMRAGVDEALNDYPEAHLVEVSLVHEENLYQRAFDPRPERVVVSVAKPPDETYPDMAQRIYDAVIDGNDVTVEVRFVEYQTSGGEPATNGTAVDSPGAGDQSSYRAGPVGVDQTGQKPHLSANRWSLA